MDKFIEITDVGGEKMLINVAHVVCVEKHTTVNDEFRCTQITFAGNFRRHTYERYEEVKKKIENAGKIYITDGIYVRRSE